VPGEPATVAASGEAGPAAAAKFPETGEGGLLALPSGQLDLGAVLTESWNVMKANAGLLIGSSTVTLLILGLVYATLFFTMAGSLVASGRWPLPTEPPPGFKVAIQIANLVLLPLYWGPLYVTHELMTRGSSDLGALFRGYRHYFTFVGATLLVYLAVFVGVFVLIIGAFVAAAALSLTWMEIVDRGYGALDAVRSSWESTKGHRLMLFACLLVLALLSSLGILACGVGIVVTAPIYHIGYVILYRELRGLQGGVA